MIHVLDTGYSILFSFGESVKLLHSFQDQFSSQSGARILQQFTFEQKKTKIAEVCLILNTLDMIGDE